MILIRILIQTMLRLSITRAIEAGSLSRRYAPDVTIRSQPIGLFMSPSTWRDLNSPSLYLRICIAIPTLWTVITIEKVIAVIKFMGKKVDGEAGVD